MSTHEIKDPGVAARFVYDAVSKTFKRSTDVDSCVALTRTISERFEATFAELKREGAQIACKPGCSFCCSWRVDVMPHEAISLFRYLKSQIPAEVATPIVQRLLHNAEKIAHMTDEQHRAQHLQCAFLVEGRCSAYKARPMTCAWHHSLDVTKCEEDLKKKPGETWEGIPLLEVVGEIDAAVVQGYQTALREIGLDGQPMELHTAVAALLRDPSLIGRWRNGRTLLKKSRPTENGARTL